MALHVYLEIILYSYTFFLTLTVMFPFNPFVVSVISIKMSYSFVASKSKLLANVKTAVTSPDGMVNVSSAVDTSVIGRETLLELTHNTTGTDTFSIFTVFSTEGEGLAEGLNVEGLMVNLRWLFPLSTL